MLLPGSSAQLKVDRISHRATPSRVKHAWKTQLRSSHGQSGIATQNGESAVDVAIVGGGLGGLVTAIALRRALPDVSVRVYEQSPCYTKAGALLGLAPNGQAALNAIDPALMPQCEAVSVPDGRTIVLNHEGTVLRDSGAPEPPGGATEKASTGEWKSLRLGWWELHQILWNALPPEIVVFDHKFSGYDEDEHGVTVRFSQPAAGDGEAAVHANVVIGADGGFSAVRRRCLDDGPPRSAGSVIWRARASAESMEALLSDGVIIRSWAGGGMVATVWLVNPLTGEGAWFAAAGPEKLKAMGVQLDAHSAQRTGLAMQPIGTSAVERAQKVFAEAAPELRKMLAATDPSSVVEHGIWVRDVERPWGAGRVSLAGDAAHPARPVTGQGFGQAAEDAHELAVQLREHGIGPAALRSFELARVDRAAHVSRVEWELGEEAYQDKRTWTAEQKAASAKRSEDYACFLASKRFELLTAEL